jgi:hypothetical protein
MRKIKTHFEQIPVEIVKKIVDAEESKEKGIGTADAVVQNPPPKTSPYGAGTGLHCRNGM